MDPEFYVEKPNKLIALTIATLNAGISIGIAASLAGSLIALHQRRPGRPGNHETVPQLGVWHSRVLHRRGDTRHLIHQ